MDLLLPPPDFVHTGSLVLPQSPSCSDFASSTLGITRLSLTLSTLDLTDPGLAVPIRSCARPGLTVSLLDHTVFEPIMPIRHMMRIGSTAPPMSTACLDSASSAFTLTELGSAPLVRSMARSGPPSSHFGIFRMGPSFSPYDFAESGLIMSARSSSQTGLAFPAFSVSRLESLPPTLDYAVLGSAPPTRSLVRLGSAVFLPDFGRPESSLLLRSLGRLGFGFSAFGTSWPDSTPSLLDHACSGLPTSARSLA